MHPAAHDRELSVLSSVWAETDEVTVTGRWPRRVETRTVVHFRDWLVDGRSLRDWISYGDPRDDKRPLMYKAIPDGAVVVASLKALLVEDVGPEEEWVSFPDGRTGILFCALCGDIWCGAISARVEVCESIVEWRDIAFQDRVTNEISADGPALTLRFEREPYQRTIRDLINGWR